MTLIARLRAYAAHRDPATAACNRIALLVASSQPTYPFYLAWLAGGTWWVACVTFLSTPFFLLVPALAGRNAAGGRSLLVMAGLGNAMLATKALGISSGVELFLLPTTLLALFAFRDELRLALLAANFAIALMHGSYGQPWGHFSPQGQAAMLRLNLWSVALLSVVILWALIPRPSARS